MMRIGFFRRFMPLFLLTTVTVSSADAAGVMLSVDRFNVSELVAARWHCEVREYQSSMLLRIEFDGVNFQGEAGFMAASMMLMNLCHDFPDDGLEVTQYFPGFSAYISCGYPDLTKGAELLVDPQIYPYFKRVFPRPDNGTYIAPSFYNTQPLSEPCPEQPVNIIWEVTRGKVTTNPCEQLMRRTDGTWENLQGTFREWLVAITIDGERYQVARYFLPESHAQFLNSSYPISLHHEFWGRGNPNSLAEVKTDVRFRDIEVRNASGSWFPIRRWKVIHVDSEGDARFGWFVSGEDLVSRSGHDEDKDLCIRTVDSILSTKPSPQE